MIVFPLEVYDVGVGFQNVFGFKFGIFIFSCAFSVDNLKARMDGLN